ncbi:hypothetical protein ACSFBI_05295 [Variovorax sp. RB3P1]|uniref:hypothetical protein n=1 Tax=Variovorax sp. RB3P1 TaxID=3443732 RepID=UPI003F485FCE
MDDVSTLTARMIQEHESDPEVVNMMYLVDQHFEIWTTQLFPHLQRKRIPCYKTVVDILHKAGHTVATESLVRSYFSVIRARRGIPAKPYKAPLGVTPTVTPTRPAREFRADPGVRVQATDRPVALAVSSHPVAVPGVEPLEVTDWHAQSRRLESEPRGSAWTAEDEWMWAFIEKKAKIRNLNIFKNAPDVEEMLDIFQIDCYSLLTRKKRNK